MDSAEGAPVATGVIQSSGNTTFRVRFEDAGEDDYQWQQLMKDLEPLSCWFDVRSPGYVAISAEPDQSEKVAGYLQQRDGRRELQYEIGS